MKKIFFVLLFLRVIICYGYETQLYYNDYTINKFENYDVITIPKTLYSDIPNQPMLPVKALFIIMPFGKSLDNLDIKTNSDILQGKYNILPTPENIPTIQTTTKSPKKSAVYYKNKFFPEKCYSVKPVAFKNGVAILTVLIYPFQYNPVTKSLKHNKNIKIRINFSEANLLNWDTTKIPTPKLLRKIFNGKNYLNYAALESYFYKNTRSYSTKSSLVSSDSPYEYIIITNGSLEPYFNTLINHKEALGLNAAIFTTEDIYANYSGSDNQEKIRNFIIDAYSAWAMSNHPLQWVLLGGDNDVIPARIVKAYAYWSSTWNVRSFASDNYYAGLDGDWDNDADGIYGEGDDSQKPDDFTETLGTNGEEADWFFEIAVGRASLEDSTEVNNWIAKTIAYENANITSNDYLRTSTMVGEYLGNNIWGADYMDELTFFLPQFDINKLYQKDGNYSKTNVINAINHGTNIITHIGHGNYLKVCSIYDGDVDTLITNTDYCLFYTQACNTGHFNGYSCIAESFIEKENGAYAYIGNTHYGFYSTFEQQGSSQLFAREFFDAISNEDTRRLGNANNDSKEDLYGIIGCVGAIRFSGLDIILFGDPNLQIYTQVDNVNAEQVSDSEIKIVYTSTPEYGFDNISNYSVYQRDDPSQAVTLSSLITNGNEVYLYTNQELQKGIPYNILISNVSGIKNPTERPIKSIYNIIELSIDKPTIWTEENGPYYIYKNLIINGSYLKIYPGTEIKIYSDRYVIAYNNGYIQALGDSTNRIHFTSYSDSSQANKEDWDLILIYRDANSDSCVFNNCIIDYATTGIYLDSLTTSTIENTIIKNCEENGVYSYFATPNISNTACSNCQNGFYFENSQLSISNIVSYNNLNYGLYLIDNSDIQIENSIIWGNVLGDFYNDGSTIQITYSDLQNTFSGTGNITQNPLFANLEEFTLSPFSPCIDSGNPSQYDEDGTIKDMGIQYYYQNQNLEKPVINQIVIGDSVTIYWENVDGAIYYNLYSADNPYSNFTLEEGTIKSLHWSKVINGEKRFYKITAGNNRN